MTEQIENHPISDCFEIGGENIFPPVGAEEDKSKQTLDDVRIRIGTLLKTETVSFLFGAGVSVECGGPLIGSVPLEVERILQNDGITGVDKPRIQQWLKVFYLAARYADGGNQVPWDRDSILNRRDAVVREGAKPLCVNFEKLLAFLYRWRSALPEKGGRLRIDGSHSMDITADQIDQCIRHSTRALACACDLPKEGKENSLTTFKIFLRKVLTRPLNLKRVNIFTLNYDTLVEQAADAEGVVLLDGFVGTHRRIFRPECYEQDLYFPAETTEGRVHRFDRVVHLYKLHGSITWMAEEPSIDNPYGVISKDFDPNKIQPLLIYPTPAKYGETLGMPYSEMFRRFANSLVRPQSVLFVIGYGFGDEHVNAIIRQALSVPSFTLVIVDPNPQSDFVNNLREQKDQRVWIACGANLGKISGFVEQLLPDLHDEDIRKKVLATWKTLDPKRKHEGKVPDGD